LPLLFAAALFVSALLLFLLQPMIGKMILPRLGGTPAVWNTCMVFFQALLLAGYAYAHLVATHLTPRRQVLLQLAVLIVPIFALPIAVSSTWLPPADANPTPWLLAILTLSVGLPFFVLSTSAPLLQKWFSSTHHAAARDPYFLYAASNLGSMLALLAYPTLVEPHLTLRPERLLSQSWIWSLGYGLLVFLVGACGLIVWRTQVAGAAAVPADAGSHEGSENTPGPSVGQRVRWVALAFVPSSLMLGATTFITFDIAAVPLLWVIPLALYLLSFILVFARWPHLLHNLITLAMPIAVLLVVFTTETSIKPSITWRIGLHLLALFVVSLLCHGELARSRPSTEHLTSFYLLMSLGGVLGGLFNALVAPLVFQMGILEYPIALVLACLLLPPAKPFEPVWISRWLPGMNAKVLGWCVDILQAAVIGLLSYALLLGASQAVEPESAQAPASQASPSSAERFLAWSSQQVRDGLEHASEWTHVEARQLEAVLVSGVPLLFVCVMSTRPLRFGLALAAFMLASGIWHRQHDTQVVHRERSFFGVLKVEYRPPEGDQLESYSLLHGTTLHGQQIRSEGRRFEAQTYYHISGPVGQIFTAMRGPLSKRNLAVVGLGTGTLASYGEQGQRITFYDIDPAVKRIASNPEYFTYLADTRAEVQVILGDARLRLEQAQDGQYDMIFVDAFSSDAIPIHLITREAIELYFRKLSEHGILAVHISNRHLDLEPVLGNLAETLKLASRVQFDGHIDERTQPGKNRSHWVILARHLEDLGSLASDPSWTPVERSAHVGVWTDDYSNLLGVFNWEN
jgi:hypothetical protein